MAAFSVLQARVGYNLGYTLSDTTPVTTTMAKQFLNDAVDYVVAKFFKRQCWKLLHELHKEKEYTLTGADSYDVYTVIGNSTDYYGFISDGDGWTASELDVFPLREVSIRNYDKVTEAGEFYPTDSRPYICFYEFDTESGHGNLPKFRIRPSSSTQTLYFRYICNPTAMSADASLSGLGDICDNLLVNYATARGWRVERNREEYAISWGEFQSELNELVGKYEESYWDAPRTDPVI